MIYLLVGAFIFTLGAICGYVFRDAWLMPEPKEPVIQPDQPTNMILMSDEQVAKLEIELKRKQNA